MRVTLRIGYVLEGVTYDWLVMNYMANRIGVEHLLEVPK